MINKNLFTSGRTIAVALSGGKDSICLLHLLLSNREQLNIKVKAIHVDHSIRQESGDDAEFVKNYCNKLNVPLKTTKVDAPLYCKQNNLSIEQGARELRYQIFNQAIQEGFCDKIATAHHKNDNFESLLFNIFRGTGLKGASGIPCKNGNIIRPLLDSTREQIEKYVADNNLPFVQDFTNFDSDYSRNYIRNQIIPKILEKFPEAIASSARFCQIAKDEDDYLDKISSNLIKTIDNKIYLSLLEDEVLLKRAIIKSLNLLGLEKNYEYIHVLQVLSLKTLQSGAKITLPKNIVAVKEYDNAVLYIDNSQKLETVYPFKVGCFEFSKSVYEISKTNGNLKFDGDKIPDGAIIRTRREGDVFKKFGGGTKKLKEFFIDKKIPLSKRDVLPVIAKDNVVYLIFGVEISDDIKVTNQTKTILYAN